jgi:hypothetical protein
MRMERKNKILRYLQCYWDGIFFPAFIFFLIQNDEKTMRGMSWFFPSITPNSIQISAELPLSMQIT